VEPIAATVRALERLARYGDTGAAATLAHLGREAQRLVPDCTGLSLTVLEDGVPITLVASSNQSALLDAMQYLDGGPCVEAVLEDRLVEVNEGDALDEGLWSLFGRASAAVGVASSLSLPIVRDGTVIGGANLYASTRDAFVGQHEALAEILGAWAPGAVTDADLSFDQRREAAETVDRITDQTNIDVATGIVAESQSVDTLTARSRIAVRRGGARRRPDVRLGQRTVRSVSVDATSSPMTG
jgi:GAF domain-containing protein